MIIHAVTFDCWGTLLLDSPASDERYRDRRLAGVQRILNFFRRLLFADGDNLRLVRKGVLFANGANARLNDLNIFPDRHSS